MLRGSAVLIAVVTVGAIGVIGASALHGRMASRNAKPQVVVASSATTTAGAATKDDTASTPPVVQQGDVTPTPVRPSVAALTPMIAIGQSSLPNGVIAQRVADTVTLSFDLMMVRTRLPEKFEAFVRATLPRIYGAPAEIALSHMRGGVLVPSQQALLYDLPTHGIHVPVSDAWQIVVYPETRPGQDGPLVIRYRAVVVPNQN